MMRVVCGFRAHRGGEGKLGGHGAGCRGQRVEWGEEWEGRRLQMFVFVVLFCLFVCLLVSCFHTSSNLFVDCLSFVAKARLCVVVVVVEVEVWWL